MLEITGDFGYARVSSDEQAKGYSVANQEIRLKEAGCTHVFSDVDSAFKQDVVRAGFESMLSYIKSGKAKGKTLYVSNLDRLSRNEAVSFALFDLLEKYDVNLKSIDQPHLDVMNSETRIWAGFSVMEARAYSARLSAKVKRGHQHHRDRNAAYYAPFGYRKIKEALELDTTPFLCLLENHLELSKASIGRDIIETMLNTMSLRKTLRTINEKYGIKVKATQGKGNKSPRGLFRFSNAGLGSWLNNPILRGHIAYHRSANQRMKHNGNWDIRYNTHADHTLMNEEEWREIERILKWNSEHGGFQFKTENIHPLSGLIWCAECGVKCRITHFVNRKDKTIKTYSYQCNAYHLKACTQKKSIREYIIENALIEALLNRSEQLKELVLGELELEVNPEVLALEEQLKEFESLAAKYGEDEFVLGKIEKLKAEIQSKSSVPTMNYEAITLTEMLNRKFLEWMKPNEKQSFYRRFVKRIEMKNGEVVSVTLKI